MRIGKHTTHPAADVFPLLPDDELEQLAIDIAQNGLEDPIELYGRRGDELILDGRNRYLACLKAKVKPRFVRWAGPDPVAHVLSRNLHRRHLNESQRAAAADKLAATANLQLADAAKLLHVSERSVYLAREARTNGSPEVLAAVERGQLAVSAAAELSRLPKPQQRAITERVLEPHRRSTKATGEVRPGLVRNLVKQAKRVELAEGLNAKPLPQPEGPFDVLVADPPWQYDKRDGDATSRGHLDYPSMTVDEICAAAPRSLAGADALLWLWTTNAHILEAGRVLDAWGFEHKTVLTWDKGRMGLGDWLRGQTEHCILAVRGRPVFVGGTFTTLLRGEVREHSRKPESFYELVEATSPGTKLELFSRAARPGWAAWGAEVQKFTHATGAGA